MLIIKIIFFIYFFIQIKSKEYTGRFENYANHSCNRECTMNSTPMICEYDWTLELYSTMSRACYKCPENYDDCFRENCILADGIMKTIETVNRMLPGPAIHVCKGDTVIVNIKNMLKSQRVTSIHWHGVKVRGSPHMDGVGMVTQCPIVPNSEFQYKFKVDEAGTHLWHSHLGIQRADGVFGAFIVREPKDHDSNSKLYDYDLAEHYIIILEWTKQPFQAAYGPIIHSGDYNGENSILINGKGQLNSKPNSYVPLETYKVKKGYRYRFRLINSAIQYCMMQIAVEGHKLTIIASDGNPIEPIVVDSIISANGERYDFVINADKEIKDYWIMIKGDGDCFMNKLFQRAILRYERNETSDSYNSTNPFDYEMSFKPGLELRTIESNYDPRKTNPFLEFNKAKYPKGLKEDYFKRISEKPDKKLYLVIDLPTYDDPEFHQETLYPIKKSLNSFKSSLIDDIKFKFPNIPPLFNWDLVDKSQFCNKTNKNKVCPNSPTPLCECTHTLEFELDELVEIILIDGGNLPENHAMHLHGHHFAFVGIGQVKMNESELLTKEIVEDMDNKGLLKRNFNNPPLKDTIVYPTKGYAIIRFIADNPGIWMLHCHLDTHSDTGMMLMIRVGNEKDLGFKKPDDWPSCGLYSRKIELENIANKSKSNLNFNFLSLFIVVCLIIIL